MPRERSQPVLLCAQAAGAAGWGHFMRMLALFRALRSVKTFDHVYLCVLSKRGISADSAISALRVAERKHYHVFATIAARSHWILVNQPRLLIWDVREHGLALSARLPRRSCVQVVLDSRAEVAHVSAHCTIATLPSLPTPTAPISGRAANLQIPWDCLLPSSAAAETFPPRSLRPTQRPVLVYVGGLRARGYWQRLCRELGAWLCYELLRVYRQTLPRARSPEQAITEVRKAFPPILVIMAETQLLKPLQLLWQQWLRQQFRVYARLFAAWTPVSLWTACEGLVATCLQVKPPVDTAAFTRLLMSARWLMTHPGLTASQALALGVPVWLLAPTPYLGRIGKTFYQPVFTASSGNDSITMTRALLQGCRRQPRAQTLSLYAALAPARRIAVRSERYARLNAAARHKTTAVKPALRLVPLLEQLLTLGQWQEQCPRCAARTLAVIKRTAKYNKLRCKQCGMRLSEYLQQQPER